MIVILDVYLTELNGQKRMKPYSKHAVAVVATLHYLQWWLTNVTDSMTAAGVNETTITT